MSSDDKRFLSTEELEQMLMEFNEQVDSQIETPSIYRFEQLVDETVAKQKATFTETLIFAAIAATILAIVGFGLNAGFVVPIIVVLVLVALFVPAMIIYYVPRQLRLEGLINGN